MEAVTAVKRGTRDGRDKVARRFVGTRGYADPTGVHETLDERSDAYSLGVVVLRLLTGPPRP